MGYILGKRSLRELEGVDQRLVDVVKLAISYTDQDFSVHDGIRTVREQEILVEKGASHTMKSKHIIGEAVDLVPYINGRLRWEWEPIYTIATAVKRASRELGVNLRWGGCWDKCFTHSNKSPSQMVEAYVARRRSMGKRAFIDGPHYELKL